MDTTDHLQPLMFGIRNMSRLCLEPPSKAWDLRLGYMAPPPGSVPKGSPSQTRCAKSHGILTFQKIVVDF